MDLTLDMYEGYHPRLKKEKKKKKWEQLSEKYSSKMINKLKVTASKRKWKWSYRGILLLEDGPWSGEE